VESAVPTENEDGMLLPCLLSHGQTYSNWQRPTLGALAGDRRFSPPALISKVVNGSRQDGCRCSGATSPAGVWATSSTNLVSPGAAALAAANTTVSPESP
jgi:hypothetical protein